MSHLRILPRGFAAVLSLVVAVGCGDSAAEVSQTDTDASTTSGTTPTGDDTTSTSVETTTGVDTTTGIDPSTTSETTTGMSTGTGTGTDTGEPPPPPGETIVCDLEIDPAPAGEVCSVTPGSDTLLLQGTVLAGFDVYENGTVLVDASTPNARITCVGCDCLERPEAATATVIACEHGVISPGLINPHDHITFTLSQPIGHGTERYDHRHEWRLGFNGSTELDTFPGSDNSRAGVLYGELRMLLGGATSISGSVGGSDAEGLLRNLDNPALTEGLVGVDVNYRTFPLGDSQGPMLATGCDYPFIDHAGNLAADVYMPHVAEGITLHARNEFTCLSTPAGEDLIEQNTSVIHGIGMTAADIDVMAQEGAMLVWSPRSNVDLYGITADLPAYRNLGVRIALGTDWSASGSMNVLRELACADAFNRNHLDGTFSDLELWLMSTYWAAASQGADDQIGLIRAGHIADLAVFDGTALPDDATPYRAIIEANPENVALVMRGGEPLHGDQNLVEALVDPAVIDGCETIDVCGVGKRLCAQLDTALSSTDIADAVHAEAYPFFFCGDPEDEPSCDPARPNEFPDRGGPDDLDGDGVADDVDNCPNIFNPRRPLDGAVQADADADGLGDACDLCPLAEGQGCTVPDLFDQDGDGVVDPDDNCVAESNADQADGDDDGLGDVCDACPTVPNPGGSACPASIYDIKDGTIGIGEDVIVQDVVVTAANDVGYFVQVHPDDVGYQGVEYSGLFVYRDGGFIPEAGDRVDVAGTTTDFYGQIQLDTSGAPDPIVLSTGNALPPAELTTPADVVEGGALQEALEGVLVTVLDVTVTDVNPAPGPGDDGMNEFEVTAGLRVNDYFYAASPFPTLGQTYSEITGIARWANEHTKLEPRSLADYPAVLTAFAPAQTYLLVGTTDVPLPELTVQLSSTVSSDTAVSLSYADPGVVDGPTEVIVPTGSNSALVSLTGVALGSADVTASLDGVMFSSTVQVYDDAQARLPTLVPDAITLPVSSMGDLSVELNLPAPVGGQLVDLAIAPGACASVPVSVFVPEGELSSTFSVMTGACSGDETVTASIGGAASDAIVTVSDLPVFDSIVLTEVYYDHPGTDDGFEWVKIYNGTGAAVDLTGYSVAWAGSDWTYGVLDLSGTLEHGACAVIGGPSGDADSGFPDGPMFDLGIDFAPDIQNSGTAGDGVALFDIPAASVTAASVPVDAVIYGPNNDSGLIDESGAPGLADVVDAPSGSSIRLSGALTWIENPTPAPLECLPLP